MAVRSSRAFGPTQITLAGGTTTLYTVPASHHFRGQLVLCEVNGAGPITFTLRINGTRFWSQVLAANTGGVIPIPVVLNPGDVLNTTVTAGAGTLAVTGFGSDLV